MTLLHTNIWFHSVRYTVATSTSDGSGWMQLNVGYTIQLPTMLFYSVVRCTHQHLCDAIFTYLLLYSECSVFSECPVTFSLVRT